jgi:hypothetical protein
MSLLDLSKSTDARLAEVKKSFALISRLEDEASKEQDPFKSESGAILRGLFFVQLYGLIEYSLSLSVQVLLQEMTKLGVPYFHFEHPLFAVVLDRQFRSVEDSGWQRRLLVRRELLQKQVSSDSCMLDDGVFESQLQNVWFETLKQIFDFLLIPYDPVPEVRISGYIDEIVNKRNEIAHGRSSAITVGRLTTVADLEIRMTAIARLIDHIIISFDEYLEGRAFIAQINRPVYLAQVPPSKP